MMIVKLQVFLLHLTVRQSFIVADENASDVEMQLLGTALPTEDHGNKFNVSSAKDKNFTEWMMDGHLAFCGKGGFCEKSGRRPRCTPCARCFCDEGCVMYDDCCPDRRLIEQNRKSRYSCNSVLYGGTPERLYLEKLHGHKKYQMIDSCPNGLIKCMDSPMLPPVTAMDNRTTFRNEVCAKCNGVIQTQSWGLSIMCVVNIDVNFKTQIEMLNATANHPNCSLTYVVPDPVRTRRCNDERSTIFTCNVTGLWKMYNEFVERACSSYIQVKVVDGQKYANPFCYICNTGNYSALDQCHKPNSQHFPKPFAALIDFENERNLPKEASNSSNRCPAGNVYDTIKKRCREVFCAHGKELMGDNCIPLLPRTQGMAYQVQFALLFSDSVRQEDLKETLEQLEKHLIRDILDNDVRSVYSSLTADWASNSSTCSNVTMEAVFYFKMVVTYIRDQIELEKLLLNLRNSSFILGHLNLTSSPGDVSDDCMNLNDCSDVETPDCMWNVSLSKEMSDYHDSDRFFIPVNGLLECPQVLLERDEFLVDDQRRYLNWKDMCLPSDRFHIQNDGKARICLADFRKGAQDGPVGLLMSHQESLATPEVLLSIICTTLSLICLTTTFIIYCVFESLRSMPGLNNANLVTALWLAQVMYLVGSGQTENQDICKAMGVIIHYTWLSAFCAMHICSFHMFRVFTTMRNRDSSSHKRRTFLQYTAYIYGVPAVVVVITIASYLATSNWTTIGYGGNMCYLSTTMGIGVAFALPIGVIILSNTLFFIFTIRVIHNRPNLTKSKDDSNHIMVYIKMSTLTGISWIIGFVAILTQLDPLIYIFTITNASQGVFLFVSFVCNVRVLGLIRARCYPEFKKEISGNTTSSYAYNTSSTGMETEVNSTPTYETSQT